MKTMILSQYDFISIWLRHFSAFFGRILCIGLFLSVSACGGSGGGGESNGGGEAENLRKCPSGEPPCVVLIAGPTEQGSTTNAPSGDKDGTAEEARFNFPIGITLGPDGNLYVADSVNNRIRKVTAQGVVSTFAGNGTKDMIDGTGIEASFQFPRGSMFDKTRGNFYTGGSGNKIRKITPEGVVTTLNADLGMTINGLTGDASGDNIYAILTDRTVRRINLKTGEEVAKSAALPNPTNSTGVVIGPEEKYLYATDQHAIYKMELPFANNKEFTRIAGGIGSVTSNFKDGTGDEARFNSPSQLVFDKGGNLYIAEYVNNRIRKLSFDKDGKVTVSTFAGTGAKGHKDASGILRVKDGAAKTATFLNPVGIAYDKDNHLFYVSEFYGNRIRKIVLPQ